MMAPLSQIDKPPSVKAGILPFGLICRKDGAFCSPLITSTVTTVKGRASSVSVMDTLKPFGEAAVYSLIFEPMTTKTHLEVYGIGTTSVFEGVRG